MRKFNLSIFAVLFLWACYVVFSSLTGNPVFFPFETYTWDESPYIRLQSVRVSTFVSVVYFLGLHFVVPNRRFRAIQFLQIFLNILTVISSLTIFIMNSNVSTSDQASFFGLVGITLIINLAARPTIRKYFNRR